MQRKLPWPAEGSKVWRSLAGFEAILATGLYWIWPLSLSFYLQKIPVARRRPDIAIEIYVSICLGLTIWFWLRPIELVIPFWLTPREWAGALCAYFSTSSVVALLDVVFLSKVLGSVESTERSLILFICNVAQIVFMFAIWYQIVGTNVRKEDALFSSITVLGTLGYPPGANTVVGLQIATDLLLFAIFLSHLVGRVGIPPRTNS